MKSKQLTLCSLFDGSGGFCLGALISGIKPVSASEIEPFPIRVTTKRLPFVKHLGDINKINGAEIEPVDIITSGSPCQDMSIAGKRDGLDGERSSLFYEAIRVIKEMRDKTNGKYPRFMVWENVPGAFSSNKGQDFKAVLEAICKIKQGDISIPQPEKWANAGHIVGDDFDIAWRVFDAQGWGVPQRRKRIYLVADFNCGRAGKILFESEGLFRYPPQGFCPWEGTAARAEKGSGTAGIGIDGYNAAISDKAAALGVNCGMSTGRNGVMVLNDQGGNRMDITEDMTCTLRAEAHHPPCVIEAAGFCTEHSANSRGIGFEKEVSPTLRAGAVPAALYENHSNDSRYTGPLEKAPTVSATYGTGGNNQPFVVEKCFDVRFTSENTKNARHNCYETETSRTIDTGGNTPDSNQGGVAVVCVDQGGGKSSCSVTENFSPTLTCTHGGEPVVAVQGSMIGRKDKNGPLGNGFNESVEYTLNTTDRHAIAYGIDRAAFNQGQNAKFGISVDEEVEPPIVARGPNAVAQPTYCTSKNSHHTIAEKELANTLVASDYKDPPMVNDTDKDLKYIVRRLMPTECARLQGFPDWWCQNLETENPTDDEIAWWRDVFSNYAEAMGKQTKPKTDNQIRKWLKNPHSDSAEYKLWGNGISLPIVVFVLSAIAYWAELE